MSLRRGLRLAAVVGVALVLPGLPSALPVPALPGSPPDCSSASPPLRYVVLFDRAVPEPEADREIRAACGTRAAYYQQIGVAVATSTEAGFAARFGPDRAYSAQAESLGAETDLAAPSAVRRAPDQLTTVRHVPGTDRSAEQWNMALIRAPQARTVTAGSPDVVVGVLDSGIDPRHPDLASAVDPERSAGCLSGRPDRRQSAWQPSTFTHGTHVAGTIAAADDGRGITGVAPGVRLASVKVVDDNGFIYPEYAVCGFMWAAAAHLRITNSSYFIDPWVLTCSNVPGQAVAHEAVRRAVQYATAHGVLSIAATGNEQMDLSDPRQDLRSPDNADRPRARQVDDHCDLMPAELPGVIAVSALGAQRVKAGYSSYGLGVVTVTAPGGDPDQRPRGSSSGCVLSTIPGGYGYACGTSVATPHVSGVAALLASSWPDADPAALAALLRLQAEPLPCPARPEHPGAPAADRSAGCTGERVTSFTGYGLVDALAAVISRPGAPARSGTLEGGVANRGTLAHGADR
ncbi:MAG: S8 family peptidase [Pseudonocardiaceae bacterium]